MQEIRDSRTVPVTVMYVCRIDIQQESGSGSARKVKRSAKSKVAHFSTI